MSMSTVWGAKHPRFRCHVAKSLLRRSRCSSVAPRHAIRNVRSRRSLGLRTLLRLPTSTLSRAIGPRSIGCGSHETPALCATLRVPATSGRVVATSSDANGCAKHARFGLWRAVGWPWLLLCARLPVSNKTGNRVTLMWLTMWTACGLPHSAVDDRPARTRSSGVVGADEWCPIETQSLQTCMQQRST
jgi:hypothetical protein